MVKAMILAAGRGTRMLPLTNITPKPLVKVKNRALIEHHIINLKKTGITEIIINVMHLGDKIIDYLGNGDKYNVKITYSVEKELLGTGGGVVNALKYLGSEPFILLSADLYTDFDFSKLIHLKPKYAHLVLVNNPEYNKNGDFILDNNIIYNINPYNISSSTYTYSNIGIFNPILLEKKATPSDLGAIVKSNIDANKTISGEQFTGTWYNVGTINQLENL